MNRAGSGLPKSRSAASLKQYEAGRKGRNWCARSGVSEATIYIWKSKTAA
jgi:hypothetical protein